MFHLRHEPILWVWRTVTHRVWKQGGHKKAKSQVQPIRRQLLSSWWMQSISELHTVYYGIRPRSSEAGSAGPFCRNRRCFLSSLLLVCISFSSDSAEMLKQTRRTLYPHRCSAALFCRDTLCCDSGPERETVIVFHICSDGWVWLFTLNRFVYCHLPSVPNKLIVEAAVESACVQRVSNQQKGDLWSIETTAHHWTWLHGDWMERRILSLKERISW